MFEVAVALLLGSLVLSLSLMALQRTHLARERIVTRIDALASFRIGRFVTRREVRHGVGVRDWKIDADSLSIRAFRGTAIVCPLDESSKELTVSFRGDRMPDPTKDSLLLVRAGGGHVVVDLISVLPVRRACGQGPTAPAVWRVDPPSPADVVLARLFERGSYHLTGAALRYRRGSSGRQPLTPEVWSMPATHWVRSGRRVGFEYVPLDGHPGSGWTGFLAWIGDG